MSAATVKAALRGVLALALAQDTRVLVCLGTPGPTPVPDVVAIMDDRGDRDGDEHTYRIDLVISCYVGGGRAAQEAATARAHEILDAIRDALYADPTLDDSCRVAALDLDHRNGEGVAYDATGKTGIGRLAEIQTEVTVWSGRPILGSVASAHVVP